MGNIKNHTNIMGNRLGYRFETLQMPVPQQDINIYWQVMLHINY